VPLGVSVARSSAFTLNSNYAGVPLKETLIYIFDFILNPLIFPIYFLGMGVVVLLMLSHMSGWARLKERFVLSGAFEDKLRKETEYHEGSGKLEGIYCRGSLIVGANCDGLILKARFPFSFFHPPLFFPWISISCFLVSSPKLSQDNFLNLKFTDPINKKAFYARYVEIKLAEFPELYLELPWHDKLNKYLPPELAGGLFNKSPS
jgi:hypothetical protein